jgi:hypothetical protein
MQYWQFYLGNTEKFLREWLTPEGATAASIADLDLLATAYPYEPSGLLRTLFYPMDHDIPICTREMHVSSRWFGTGMTQE